MLDDGSPPFEECRSGLGGALCAERRVEGSGSPPFVEECADVPGEDDMDVGGSTMDDVGGEVDG